MAQFQSFLETLDPSTKSEVLESLKRIGASRTASLYFEKLGCKKQNLYPILLREHKRLYGEVASVPEAVKGDNELTDDDIALLEKFKNRELGFDEMHRELAIRAFKKILLDPKAIKVRDWLQSELVKIKKDENTKQADAMKNLFDGFFSGLMPQEICPHCGKSTVVRKEDISDAKPLEIDLE